DALANVVLLPRTIDKVRATLAGGAPGEYTIPGLSRMMLDTLEIDLAAFTSAVADAQDDAAVARFVTAATTPERIAAWNAWILARFPRGGDRDLALQSYPWLAERPELPLALDVLEEDDRRHFARRS
ncbi:MAG: DUF5069 domain-containing protein, partial [Candidatus Eremiobacteraeota bacterium]|nr:DUF5069 domain-containing protein [Candidatus Eremiobacteraeota bacterium]